MDLTYFKRYRMEIGLAGRDFTPRLPPGGYRFLPWHPSLLDAFAEAKYLSFRGEIDANVFPCLGELSGCRRLMNEISRKPGFLAEATWVVQCVPPRRRRGGALRHDPGRSRQCRTRRHSELGNHAGASQLRPGDGPALPSDAGIPARRLAAGLLGSDRRERRRHSALSPLRLRRRSRPSTRPSRQPICKDFSWPSHPFARPFPTAWRWSPSRSPRCNRRRSPFSSPPAASSIRRGGPGWELHLRDDASRGRPARRPPVHSRPRQPRRRAERSGFQPRTPATAGPRWRKTCRPPWPSTPTCSAAPASPTSNWSRAGRWFCRTFAPSRTSRRRR